MDSLAISGGFLRASEGGIQQTAPPQEASVPSYATASATVPISNFPKYVGPASLSAQAPPSGLSRASEERSISALSAVTTENAISSPWKPKTPPPAIVALLDSLLQVVGGGTSPQTEDRKCSLDFSSPLDSARASESADGKERSPCCAATDEDFYQEDAADSGENSLLSDKGGDSHSSAFTFRGPPSQRAEERTDEVSSSDRRSATSLIPPPPHSSPFLAENILLRREDTFALQGSATPKRLLGAATQSNSLEAASSFWMTKEERPDLRSSNTPERSLVATPNLVDRGISDRGISDRGISDREISDREISDREISDRGISDRGISDRGISDRGISDRGISDRGISDRGISDRGNPPRRVAGPASAQRMRLDAQANLPEAGGVSTAPQRDATGSSGSARRNAGLSERVFEVSPADVASQLVRWIGDRLGQLETSLREAAQRDVVERGACKLESQSGPFGNPPSKVAPSSLPQPISIPPASEAGVAPERGSNENVESNAKRQASFGEAETGRLDETASFMPQSSPVGKSEAGLSASTQQEARSLPPRSERCLNMALLCEALPRIELIQTPSIQPAVIVRQGVAPVVRIFTSSPVAFANAFPSPREKSGEGIAVKDNGANSFSSSLQEVGGQAKDKTCAPSVVIHRRASLNEESAASSSLASLATSDLEERVWRPSIFIEVTDAWWPSVSIRHHARRGGVVLAGPVEPLIECKPVI